MIPSIHIYPPVTVQTSAGATAFIRDGVLTSVFEDTLDAANTIGLPVELSEDTQANLAELKESTRRLSPVDFIDSIDYGDGNAIPLLDTSVTAIPDRADSPLEIVESLASNCKKIQIGTDIGSFIGLYGGEVGSEQLVTILPFPVQGDLFVDIEAGTRLSVRALGADALNFGNLTMVFLG